MARPSQFRTKRAYDARMKGKANKNLETMAVVGNGDGATFQVAGRDSFYWIRLVNDDNRLTQCFCDICALSYGDMIFVARAKDEKLSYYEFVRFIQNADGDTTDPPICPKFAQVVYVSENSCQFNTVGAAVTYINALVTGPAAGRLFLIKCQAGNFGEAGDVTIPQYVHLEGVGEASELEMGANTLILSGDTSVSNIVVESSDPADAIRCNGVTNVVLRNVRGIQSEAADVFHIYGASGVEMYHCIAESTVVGATGFHVGNMSVVYMDDCIAYDSTNFADALLLDATLCTVVSRWCTFIGSGDDVQTGANSAWYHLDCYFYETNVTLAAGTHYALPTKRFNQTLVVAEQGGDFQALSEAITFINAQGDAAAGKLYGVLMLTGNFAEAGDVTIPQYVHVAGMGEGTRIEMGANDILMSNADASLLDLVVITTDDYAVNITASVTLRNVRAEVSGTALAGFRVGGGSPKLYDCVVDPLDATSIGFTIGGTGTTLLDHCIADDSTLFTRALDITGTATAITRYCCFAGATDDVNQAAGTNWYHFDDQFDPNNITLGGTHVAMPGKRFNQTVIVAEEGGDFQSVLEAVSWINAQGDAASDKRYGILVLTGNFAEAAGYTIPQWVTVAGMGDGSRIELGANTINMSDDSYLQDLVLTATAVGTPLRINNADCGLFNVKAIISFAPGNGIDILGDSDCELYHVTVEYTTSGVTVAFNVRGTATVLLWDCQADDTTNIQTALNLANSACTCTTRYCVFHGSTDDVATGAASTWIYHQDDFDPDNCTVGGTAEPADGQEVVYFACTKTAGAASDFATVQAAIDWFKNRLLCADCKIDIVTGTSYAETLVIEDVFATAQGRLELEGDTRGMTGATFVDDAPITCQDANAGSGTCALSNAGAVITVTGTVANPDFDADGWGNGDTVITRDNAGAIATYTISATLNNTITLTVAAPAVGNTGTSLTLVPDTVIAPSGAGNAVTNYVQGVLLDGLYLDATAGATGHGLLCYGSGAQCQCENILSEADEQGFLADWGALIEANDGACTAVECAVGFYARYEGGIAAELGVAVGCGTAGFYGARAGMLLADDAVATDCTSGFLGGWLGGCWCDDAYALQNTSYGFYVTRQGFLRCNNSRTLATNGTDYRSEYNSYMSAPNTNVGGPTYSPAVSDTEGNVYGIITFS